MTTISELLLQRSTATPHHGACLGAEGPGLSFSALLAQVDLLARGLLGLGLEPRARVAIAAGARVEEVVMQLAVLRAGGVAVGIRAGLGLPSVIEETGAQLVVVESHEAVAAIRRAQRAGGLTSLREVIVLEGPVEGALTVSQLRQAAVPAQELEARAKRIAPEDLATVLFTAGTTGAPKGVELTHRSWVAQAEAIAGLGLLSADDVVLATIPVSHSVGMALLVAQLKLGFQWAIGGRESFFEALARAKPTVTVVPPEALDRAAAALRRTGVGRLGLAHGALAQWAFKVGASSQPARGLKAPRWAVANWLVLGEAQQRLGGRLRLALTGGAPLAPSVTETFTAVGVEVREGYGLAEAGGLVSMSRPGSAEAGLGAPLPGVEVKVADDGELLVRGPAMMVGYAGRERATKRALSGGWLRTGDLGSIGVGGAVRWLGRKAPELSVEPQEIARHFEALCPYVARCTMGDRSTLSITLDEAAIGPWAQANGLSPDLPAIAGHPRTTALLAGFVATLNARLPAGAGITSFGVQRA